MAPQPVTWFGLSKLVITLQRFLSAGTALWDQTSKKRLSQLGVLDDWERNAANLYLSKLQPVFADYESAVMLASEITKGIIYRGLFIMIMVSCKLLLGWKRLSLDCESVAKVLFFLIAYLIILLPIYNKIHLQ